jgi:hypothetical protein
MIWISVRMIQIGVRMIQTVVWMIWLGPFQLRLVGLRPYPQIRM